MVRERIGAPMSPRGPGAVALTLGFTSLRSHPVYSGAKYNFMFLLLFPHPGAISPMGVISPMGAISRMITVYNRAQNQSLYILGVRQEMFADPACLLVSRPNVTALDA